SIVTSTACAVGLASSAGYDPDNPSRGGQGFAGGTGAGQMILRVIRGRGTEEQIARLRAAIDAGSAERIGLERFLLGWRPATRRSGEGAVPEGVLDVAVIAHWSSAEAASTADRAGTSLLSAVRTRLHDA